MGQCGQNTGAVTSILFITNTTTMLHGAVHLLGLAKNCVACPPLDVADESDPAAIAFVSRIVKTVFRRQTEPVVPPIHANKANNDVEDPAISLKDGPSFGPPSKEVR